MLGRCAIAIEASKEHLRRCAPDGCRVLRDDGDAWFQKIGKQNVVESNQGHTSMQVHAPQRAKCADGDQVLTGEQGGGGLRKFEQLGGGGFRPLDSAKVEWHQQFLWLQFW